MENREMAMEQSTFEIINPSRFTTFTFPNPNSDSLLRVAVLDSPFADDSSPPPLVAAMLVPKHRHSDWIFSTHSGHLQLLLTSPSISRLILVTDTTSPQIYRRPLKNDMSYNDELASSLQPLFLALSPKSSFKHGTIPEIPILNYQDNLISSLVLEKCVGSCAGELLVEDVEIEVEGSIREFRRRLRFKRMPNLVQTEIRIVPKIEFGLESVGIGEAEFGIDGSVLVHSYLVPMVASLSLAGDCIEGRIRSGVRPKALCLGVGGGALLVFLRTQFGFQVVGVEADEEVVRVARRYFGLEEDGEDVEVCVGDALRVVEKLEDKFDVIMVDLDSGDATDGLTAPSLEFARKYVLLKVRSILCDDGIVAVNVIPANASFYKTLVDEFRDVFHELYEIDVGNGENFVLVAAASPLVAAGDHENCFLDKLGKAISGAYLSSIKKI